MENKNRIDRATHAKISLIRYFLFDRNFICAMHEISIYSGVADVLGVSDKGKVYEVEIKVDWADFKSEIDAMKQVKGNNMLFEDKKCLRKPKYEKHFLYLLGKERLKEEKIKIAKEKNYHQVYIDMIERSDLDTIIPNKFFFAVPYEMKEKAIIELQNEPYGVMDLSGNVHKKAKDLHNEDVATKLFPKLLRRLSVINYNQ